MPGLAQVKSNPAVKKHLLAQHKAKDKCDDYITTNNTDAFLAECLGLVQLKSNPAAQHLLAQHKAKTLAKAKTHVKQIDCENDEMTEENLT